MQKIRIIGKVKNKKLRTKVATDLCDDCLYKAIHEVALNTKNHNMKISQTLKKKLMLNKKIILRLSNKEKNYNKRRKLVIQSGGFLHLILPALASALRAVANEALRKN